MGIMIFMIKSQHHAIRWPNNLRARLYIVLTRNITSCIMYKNNPCNVS